jgi:hypothetical protein
MRQQPKISAVALRIVNFQTARLIGICLLLVASAGCGRPVGDTDTASSQGAVTPHLSVISGAARTAAFAAGPSGGIAMDAIDSQPGGRGTATTLTLGKSQSLSIVGWAFPPSATGGCSAIGLTLDNKRVFPGTYGYGRVDVATNYKNDALTNVGYSIVVPASKLGTGTHHAFVVCIDAAQAATRSFNPLTITVR